MLDLDKIKFAESNRSDRDNKILSFVNRKIREINQRKSLYQEEWQVMEDHVYVRDRKRKFFDKNSSSNYDNDSDQIIVADDWRSHIEFPLPMSVMKRQAAEFMRNQPRPVFYTSDDRDIANLKVFEKIYDWQLEEAEYAVQLLYAYIDSRIKGIGFMEVGYLEKYKNISDVIFDTGIDGTELISPAKIKSGEIKRILDYDGLFCRRIDPNNVWTSNCVDLHSNVNGAELIIVKDPIISYERFRHDFLSYKNAKTVLPTSWDNPGLDDTNSKYQTEQDKNQSEAETDGYVHIYRVYQPDIDEVYIIANNEVIYDGPNIHAHKQAPVIALKNVPYPGNLYTPGETTMMEQANDVRNVNMSLSIDRDRMNLQPHMFITDESVDPDELEMGVGGYSFVKRGFNVNEAIQTYQPAPNSNNTLDISREMENEIIRMTGVDINAQFPPPSEKVTQTALKKEESSIIFGLYTAFNSALGLKDFHEMAARDIMQFLPREKVRHFLQPDGTLLETFSYPEVKLKDYKKKFVKKKRAGTEEIMEMVLEESPGQVAVFEARPEFVRHQLLVKVKEGEIELGLESLKLDRFNAFLQILLSNPNMTALIDNEKLLSTFIRKYKIDPDEILPDRVIEESNKSITEPQRELRSLIVGIEYIEQANIDHQEHADFLRRFVVSDAFRKGVKNPINGKLEKIKADAKARIMIALDKHEQLSLGLERPQPTQEQQQLQQLQQQQISGDKPGSSKGPEGQLTPKTPKKTPFMSQTVRDPESEARSMAGKISKGVLKS